MQVLAVHMQALGFSGCQPYGLSGFFAVPQRMIALM